MRITDTRPAAPYGLPSKVCAFAERAAAADFNRGCPMYVPTPRLGGLSGRVACSSCAAAPSRAPHALSGTGDEMMFSS